jgi:hypothetical protein
VPDTYIKEEARLAKYDAEGFVTSYQPHMTETQVHWLSHRMGCSSDSEACELAQVDRETVDEWMDDAEFFDVYRNCLENKREAFRYLATQLLPKTLRTIIGMLDSDSGKVQAMGVQLLLRTQALLIDRKAVVDRDSVAKLVAALRQETPVVIQGHAQAVEPD